MKLKTGDKVIVIAGSNKGKEGKIIKKLEDKVIIEGVNLRKKHLKPKNNNGTGEIVETEAEPVLEETDDFLDNSKELMKKRRII